MQYTECRASRSRTRFSSLIFHVSIHLSGVALLACPFREQASLAEHWGGLLVFISSFLVKRLIATTTEDWDKDGGSGGCVGGRRGQNLPVNLWHYRFMTCGTDVFREESGEWMHSLSHLVMRPGCDFSGVRGHRGWTQPANLLSAVLLEEISLISWCNKCLTHRLNNRSVYLGVLGTNLDVFMTQSWPVLHMRSEFVCIWGQSLSACEVRVCLN